MKWKVMKCVVDNLNRCPNNKHFAKTLLEMLSKLRKNKFFNTAALLLEYSKYLGEISNLLDGDEEIIKEVVKAHFMESHIKSGGELSSFDIKFYPKGSGHQVGTICDVLNGNKVIKYYIKTHQNGPSRNASTSFSPPDAKELFVYKLLELIGIGPIVDFILPYHGSKRTIYIATKEVPLVLLSNLSKANANNAALLQVDFVTRILCLHDTSTNEGNFGLVGN